MKSYSEKSYQGRIYETKESFVIESAKETEDKMKCFRIEDPSDFINSKLKEFDKKSVKIEVTIKIEEI